MFYTTVEIPSFVLLGNIYQVNENLYVYSKTMSEQILPGSRGYLCFLFVYNEKINDNKILRTIIDDFIALLRLFHMSFCDLFHTTSLILWNKLDWKAIDDIDKIINTIQVLDTDNYQNINLERMIVRNLIKYTPEQEISFIQVFNYFSSLREDDFNKETNYLLSIASNFSFPSYTYGNDYIRMSLLYTIYERLQNRYNYSIKNELAKIPNYSKLNKYDKFIKKTDITAELFFGFETEIFSKIICTHKNIRNDFYHFGKKSENQLNMISKYKTVNWDIEINELNCQTMGVGVFQSALMNLMIRRLYYSMFVSIIAKINNK